MRRSLLIILTALALILPTTATAQSGDASWLNGLEGLESAIGRSWMAPLDWTETTTSTDTNAAGTAFVETTAAGTPASTPSVARAQPLMISALIYQFDSPDHAAAGLAAINTEQVEAIARDPRSPAINSVATQHLGDAAVGHEGTFAAPMGDGSTVDLAVVYLMVQDDDVVYQVFGQYLPGDHIAQTEAIARALVDADAGSDAPLYDMNGASTGGLWEPLNAVETGMPAGTTISDLQIYPATDDSTSDGSVAVPHIDLDQLGAVPGLVGSWHIAYGPAAASTPIATPAGAPEGVYSIEVWVLEFEDATYASAAAFSLDTALTEPLGIVTTEGSGFGADDGSITLVSTGFVRDRSLPEGDAATVVQVSGTTIIATRVYANGPAPTPIARDLVASISAASPGESDERATATEARGGHWDLFPAAGDGLLHGLVPNAIRHEMPADMATPAG